MVRKRLGYVAGLVLLCTGFATAMEVTPSADRGTKQDPPKVQSATAFQHHDAAPTVKQQGSVPNIAITAQNPKRGVDGTLPTAKRAPAGGQSPVANLGDAQSPPSGYRDDPCADAIVNTGAVNGVNGLLSERNTSDGTFDSWSADDVTINNAITLGGIVSYHLTRSGSGWDGTMDYEILDGSSGAPDDSNIVAQGNLPACATDTGTTEFGIPVIIYSIYPNVNINSGTWYTATRPVVTSSFTNYWATANPSGQQGYFQSAFFTGGAWEPASTQLGQDQNFSYCWLAPFSGGACCKNGDCTETTQQDCTNNGGTYQGDGVPCCSAICPGRAAGCCFPDGSCQNLKPADCDAAGGVYQGEQNLCRPGLCPVPDPCDGSQGNVVYTNAAWDGVNGLFNSRSTDGSGIIDAQIVDDVFFCDQNTTLQSLHWYDLKFPGAYNYAGTSDWYLYDTTGTGGSPGNVVYGGETIGAPSFELDTGQQLFGYEIWQNNINGIGQAVAPGLYWTGMRPNQTSYAGPAYWLTAPLLGLEGWFRSPIFGVPNWEHVSSQLGTAEDFAFCVVGDVTGTNTGACCNNGDCSQLSSGDCKNSGGTYSGDCTSCFPNSCPGAPGACCFPDGTCQMLKPADCDAQGGSFTQSGQQCTPGLCPLPDPCDGTHGNVIYNNSVWDGVNGLFNSRSTDGSGFIDAEIVDDVFFCDKQTTLQSLHWYDIKDSGYSYTGTSDWYLFDTTGGGGSPGNVVYGGETIGAPAFELDTGQQLFFREIWQNNIDNIGQAVAPGLYWTGMRSNQSSFTGACYWLTAPLVGLEGYFRSPIFGIPNWVHVSQELGTKDDFAFCVVGDVTGQNTGGCCNNGDCANMTQSDCTNSGGTYQGDCTSCVPNTCPGAPGACCASDFSCQELKPADCDASGGVFLGSGTSCTPNPCGALACQDALYDNGQPDGVNGLTSERDNAIESYTADDVTFGQTVTVQDFHFYGLTGSGYGWNNTGDLIVVNDGGSCDPTDTVTEQKNLPQTRIDLGYTLFGFEVYLYNFENLNIQLSAGTYWFGARPVGTNSFGRNFWATAPAQSCNAQIKSVFFGFPNWTDWSNLGITADVAFCITGHTGESTLGGCCLNGDCNLETQQDCTNSGGTYQGNGTSCFPNTCPGAPGACCASDFSCSQLKPKDCDASGGVFLGSGTECHPNPCGALACQDALYDNGQPDGVNGLTSERDNAIESYTADDVTFSQTVTVTDFHFYALTGSGYGWNGTGDLIVVNDGGSCNPTDTVTEMLDLPNTRADLGYTLFGFEVYLYTFDGLNVQLTAGTYWFGARPVGTNSFGRNFWATAPAQSCNAQIKSAFFGFPNWTDWSQLGITADVAFCVTGQVGESKLGACCNNGDCALLTQTDCENSGGTFQGNGTSCNPNLCPGAAAACCMSDGRCLTLKKSDCDSQGGTYQGEGTSCKPGLCPIPDPCADAVYNNSAYDGTNGFADQRDDALGIDAIAVSDIDLGSTTTLSSVHWYSVDDAINPTTFDFFQLNDDGNCEPDQSSEAVTSDISLSSRLDTGNILFGRHVFQYNGPVTTTLNGGQSYFLGMRPHTTGSFSGQSFILTAPRDTCPSYWKSSFFGFPNYTLVSQVFGVDEDTAWCAVAGGNPCAGIVLGDSNGDGSVDFNDIDCFVAALIGQDAWVACGTQYPASAYLCANDVNKDGSVDFNDIDTFVTCLINNGCP